MKWLIGVWLAWLPACGQLPCVSAACADTLLVNVVDASGAPLSEFEASYNDVTITCSSAERDARCTAYGFATTGNPSSLKVAVSNLETGASTTVTLTPIYSEVEYGSGDCTARCFTATVVATVS